MISDGIIKQKFIIDKLKDAAESAYRFQLNSFGSRLKSKSGNTLSALTAPDYTITSAGERFTLSSRITKQLRFQDMGVRRLYTRPLFGALKHIYGQLQYGLLDEIKEEIREELENALDS